MPALPLRVPGRHTTARARLPLVVVLLAACAVGCGVSAGPPEPYTHTFKTKEAAAQAVADALAVRDVERLASLAITEVEFRKNVWPSLPASAPEVGMPLEYLWAETSAKSRGYMAEVLSEFGGQRLTVQDVTFVGQVTDYGPFRIHPKTRLAVTDARGRTQTVRLFGSLLEANGEWKIFSFVVD